ncbi:N-acetylglucosamine-6-phosphate deacetylase [Brachybacterium sp. p3-SID957]|uniref:N-acetylglucosamine-6-phosphate deacetylase n=1 Tax=Brachybacterium sp. p3-SID957 TaxID=2916049 RepID=UPI00223BED4D|nr:amidohydrolase family protein [Brachybacterium sp. p3-SID957]MCT1775532.1 amidohydrolase family protein [Brachybacterium sp. p3-SID957]
MTTWEGRDPTSGRVLRVSPFADSGVISEVRASRSAAADLPWLVPGYVDLQVNGYGGYDVNGPDVTPETIGDLADALARRGTTTFVPTVITGSEEAITASLRAVALARRSDPRLARAVPFAHVEGPFIAEEDGPRGAHDLNHVRPPSLAELDRWQEASDGVVGMVTISPHHPGAAEFTAGAVARGVQVAVGHTSATAEEIRAVVDAGATLSTHLGNGAHAVLPRHPNYIWAQLADDRLRAGFIADGHHLPADTLTAMLRAKGLERSFLVSDSVALAGMPAGTYDTPVGGQVELSADGRLVVAGTPYLAGAVRCLAECVAAAWTMTGLPVADVVRLATANPARVLAEQAAARAGRSSSTRAVAVPPGRITPGAPADLLLLDPETAEVREVVRGGEVLA